MQREIERRLNALESRPERESGNPMGTYRRITASGFQAPEPYSGEGRREWLSRVPLETLKALMAWRDANAQP